MNLRRPIVLLALAASAPAFADVDPKELAAIVKIKPADYPSANVVLLRSDQAVVYQKDGSYTNTESYLQVALTPAGKTYSGSTTLNYTKDAEAIDVLVARVIKKDGHVIDIPHSSFQDTERSGEENIYDPQGRALKVTFTGVEVGDAIDVKYKFTRKLPTRPNFFTDTFWFQSELPIVEATYSVDGPASMPLTSEIYHAERGSKIAATKEAAGDRTHYAWRVDNEPQLVAETGMDQSIEVPLLVISTDPSWQHFSKWWAELTEAQMDLTPELKAKAAELTKDAKTDAEKIKALYDFVAGDIRYRGLGVGPRTGYTPRKASETYTSRWGVCRDVSILLTTMLRSQGFTAYPVLTNVGDPVLPKIAYDGFNHAIVAMPKAGGGWTYLDPTAKNNNELLPGNEAEQSTLVSTKSGEGLTQIPAAPPSANLGHAIATSIVNADGSMTSTVKLETKGFFDMMMRGVAAGYSEDQQRQGIESIIHAAFPDAKLDKVTISPAFAMWQPMTVEIAITVPKAAVATGDVRLLRTLVTSGAIGLVENVLPQVLGGEPDRKYTLDATMTFQYDEDETVTLPAGTKLVALPNDAHVDNTVSAVDSTCKESGKDKLSCHRSFKLRSRFIEPAQYGKLQELLASLGRIAKQPVILGGAK